MQAIKCLAMSKAFRREDANDEAEEPAVPAAPAGKNYITPGGYARLEAELRKLVELERPEVVKTVAWAASLGDCLTRVRASK